jgi:hypothetical protein
MVGIYLASPPRRPGDLVLLALLIGCPVPNVMETCDTDCKAEPESCDDVVAPVVAACFGGGELAYEGFGTLEASFEGTVVSFDEETLPEACVAHVGNASFAEGRVLVLEDAEGVRYVVGLTIPGIEADLFEAGEYVYVSASYTFGEWGPDEGYVAIADEDGAVRVVLGEAGSPESLPVPEVVVTAGEQRCTVEHECGDWAKYDVEVAVGDYSATVPYGEEASLATGRVIHGGFDRQLPGDTQCEDWYVARLTLAFVDD